MIRVTQYEATVHYRSTGSSRTMEYQFTQPQADEVGGVLALDGLDIVLAQKLCDMWTRRGQHTEITYRYRILTKDALPQLDEKSNTAGAGCADTARSS